MSKKEKDVVPEETKWCPKQVFVSGLPYTTTEDELKEFFKAQQHAITEIKMPKY
jgi:RNA recognition motif-containing protein